MFQQVQLFPCEALGLWNFVLMDGFSSFQGFNKYNRFHSWCTDAGNTGQHSTWPSVITYGSSCNIHALCLLGQGIKAMSFLYIYFSPLMDHS